MSVQELFVQLGIPDDKDLSYELDMMWIPLDLIEDITWRWKNANTIEKRDQLVNDLLESSIEDFEQCYENLTGKQKYFSQIWEKKIIFETWLVRMLEGIDDEESKLDNEMYNYCKLFIINK